MDFQTETMEAGGRAFRISRLLRLTRLAKRADKPLREIMARALSKDIWPENLCRNHGALTASQQIRLLESSVLVAGLGGLGGYAATLLARAGVGKLILCDRDRFDVTNLNRQILANTRSLGNEKAYAAAQAIRLVNPATEAVPETLAIDPENAARLVAEVQLVMDGLDQISTRRDIFNAAMKQEIPFVHGAVDGWSGQVATFLPKGETGLDAVYAETPEAESPPPVMASTAAVVAALQTAEAIRILTAQEPLYPGRMAHYDGLKGTVQVLGL